MKTIPKSNVAILMYVDSETVFLRFPGIEGIAFVLFKLFCQQGKKGI